MTELRSEKKSMNHFWLRITRTRRRDRWRMDQINVHVTSRHLTWSRRRGSWRRRCPRACCPTEQTGSRLSIASQPGSRAPCPPPCSCTAATGTGSFGWGRRRWRSSCRLSTRSRRTSSTVIYLKLFPITFNHTTQSFYISSHYIIFLHLITLHIHFTFNHTTYSFHI